MFRHGCVPILLVALGLSLSPQAVHADGERPRWTLQVDPLTAALGYAHLQVEHAFSDRHSVYLGPHLRLYDSVFASDTQDYTGIGVEAAYRYFWRAQAPTGPWVQARGVVSRLSTSETSTPGGYFGGLVGYSWILQDRWVLALGAGVQYIHMQIGELGVKGVLPAAHTALGVAF